MGLFFKENLKNDILKPGVVAHACNPSTWEAETRGSGFTASLSYLVRLSTTLHTTALQEPSKSARCGGARL